MTKSFSFYDVVNDTDVYHIQCEWFNVQADLEQDENVDYAVVHVTNLKDYWHCSIDRDLLIKSFPVSNALIQEQRNNVLTAAFRSEESLNGSKLEWKISLNENDQLQMRLRTFDGEIPLTAGSFLLEKVPESQYQDLHKSWFANSAAASCSSTQVNKALQQRITDITKTNNELKETIESMNVKESKNKFVMIDKFVRLLNHKKRKIFSLEQLIKTANDSLNKANEQLKKRKREDEETESNTAPERVVKQQKVEKIESASVSIPAAAPAAKADSDDDYFDSDDDIDCPQTVR